MLEIAVNLEQMFERPGLEAADYYHVITQLLSCYRIPSHFAVNMLRHKSEIR